MSCTVRTSPQVFRDARERGNLQTSILIYRLEDSIRRTHADLVEPWSFTWLKNFVICPCMMEATVQSARFLNTSRPFWCEATLSLPRIMGSKASQRHRLGYIQQNTNSNATFRCKEKKLPLQEISVESPLTLFSMHTAFVVVTLTSAWGQVVCQSRNEFIAERLTSL